MSVKAVATTTVFSPLPPAVPGCQDQMLCPPQVLSTLPIHTSRCLLNQAKHHLKTWVPQDSYYLPIISASSWRSVLVSFYKGTCTNLLLVWVFKGFNAQSEFLSFWMPLEIKDVSLLSHTWPCFYFVAGCCFIFLFVEIFLTMKIHFFQHTWSFTVSVRHSLQMVLSNERETLLCHSFNL